MAYKVLLLFLIEVFSLKDIGIYLKQARINNGVSLDEASEDLNLSIIQLENIEEGNVRAFKDIFSLREYIKEYAKYLGLNVDELSEEFNDFMFEKTSKISLTDIYEAKISQKEDTKKIASPYTRIRVKREFPVKVILSIFAIVLVIVLFIFGLIRFTSKDRTITSELLGKDDVIYEFTY